MASRRCLRPLFPPFFQWLTGTRNELADERRLKELLRLAVKDLTHTTDDRLGKVDMVLKDMKNAPPVLREDARVLAKDIWKFHTDGRSRRESRMEL